MFVGCGCHCNPPESYSSDVPSIPSTSSASGSIQSFGSSIADPPGDYPVSGCAPCRDFVAPLAYEFDWDYNGELGDANDIRPCCAAYRSIKTITVRRYSVKDAFGKDNPNFCWYRSNEHAFLAKVDGRASFGFFPTYECLSYTEANNAIIFPPGTGSWPWLANFRMSGDPADRPIVYISFVSRYYTVNPLWPVITIISQANYKLTIPAGATWLKFNDQGQPYWDIPCLTPLPFALQFIQNPTVIDQDLGPGWDGAHFNPFNRGVWGGAPCKQVRFSGFDMNLPRQVILRPVAT
jgi:hypothetical protein